MCRGALKAICFLLQYYCLEAVNQDRAPSSRTTRTSYFHHGPFVSFDPADLTPKIHLKTQWGCLYWLIFFVLNYNVWRQKCVLDSGVQDLQSLRKCVSHAVSKKQNTLGARNHESIPCRNTTSIWQQMKLVKNSRGLNSCIKFLGAFQNAYSLFQMLNCILGMVDKTKRALTILQQRNVHGCGSATSPVGNPDPRNRCDNSC